MHFRLLILCLSGLICLCGFSAADDSDELIHFSKKREEALVVNVTNADMIMLENGQRLKLIGIEAVGRPPRKYAQRDKNGMIIEEKPDAFIPLEEQAVAYAQSLLEGKKIKLEYDVEALSSDNYKQAYVFLPDGRLANVALLRQGFVHLKIRPPNVKYADQLRQAYQEAKREQRGFLSD